MVKRAKGIDRIRKSIKPSSSRSTLEGLVFEPQEHKKLERLERGLSIDEHALEEALQQQVDFFYEVSQCLTLQVSRRDAMRQYVAQVEADTDQRLRQEALTGDEKITERDIEARKVLDREVSEARSDLLKFNHSVAEWGNLKDAFGQRSYVLKDMVALYIRNYFGDTVQEASEAALKGGRAEHSKRTMARMRRGG